MCPCLLRSTVDLCSRPETTRQDVLNATQGSDPSPRIDKDVVPSFWTDYERVATQYDDEFIERQSAWKAMDWAL
jgi:hypothetical protein